jgi:hypothetical protein
MFYPSYELTAQWVSDKLPPPLIGAKVIDTFHKLEPLSPAMCNWLILEGPDYEYYPLDVAVPRMTSLVENSLLWKSEDGPDDPRCGYQVLAKGSAIPSEFGAADSVHIWITAGGDWEDSIRFTVGDAMYPNDFSIITYPVYRGALETFASIWPIPWALAYTWSTETPPVDEIPPCDGRRQSPFEVAWIGYLSPALALGLDIPPELVSEETQSGGVILSAVEGLIDPQNPDHMRRSRALQAVMTERVGVRDQYFGPKDHAAREGPY